LMDKSLFVGGGEYGEQIRGFLARDFNVGYGGAEGILEAVQAEILGSNKVRFGPVPKPEDLVSIRTVIRDAISDGKPIPMLVPWGSEKPDGSSIDVAELGALKTLKCLHVRVQQHHKPGIEFAVRIEDLTAVHLFDDRDKARREAAVYTSALVKVNDTLGLSEYVKMRPETLNATEDQLFEAVAPIEKAMVQYLADTRESTDNYRQHTSWRLLAQNGWRGVIPHETREHYYSTYFRLYPGISKADAETVLARYLSAALVRNMLDISGPPKWWEGKQYIKLAFFQPVPGVPPGATVFYRTVPANITNMTMPAWRSKGYLRISNDDTRLGLTTFGNEPDDIIENTITVGGVEVRADFVQV